MTINFQKNILKYLFQNKTKYLEYISPELFDSVEYKALFELFINYMRKYKKLPNKDNFIEFINDQPGLTDQGINLLLNNLVWIYDEIDDIKFIEEKLLNEVKKKMFKNVLLHGMKCMDEGLKSDDIENIHKKISKITSLNNDKESSGLLLLKDLNKSMSNDVLVLPTYLKTLNSMTARGGFYNPQVLTFIGPPKSFKTGFLIKFAAEYMKDGYDIFYADFENGETQIHHRFKQCLLECKIDEVNDFNIELNEIKDKLLSMIGSGEVFIKEYRKRQDHFGHIEMDLDKLLDDGIKPSIMIYDYINIMGCSDKSQKDPRLKIQHNYADAYNINKKYGTFCMTVAKMRADSWDKEWPSAEDVAEDKEIVYNSHSVFAIMRTEEDIEEGLGRIIPIAQRQGVSYTKISCNLSIDPENFKIQEL